tara:strand:+ start:109 stop:390 length:282 start_codon:yes stop_codon:yes gene_type:complete
MITNKVARLVGKLPAGYSKEAEVQVQVGQWDFVWVAKLSTQTHGQAPAYFKWSSAEQVTEISRKEYVALVTASLEGFKSGTAMDFWNRSFGND